MFGDQASKLSGVVARFLGWLPDAFWAATPAELVAVLQDEAVELVAGDELARLMEQYPDG